MRILQRVGRTLLILCVFGVASYLALQHGTGGLWRGLEAAHAVTAPGVEQPPYDLTQLTAVTQTLEQVRLKYVDPDRIDPRQMFLSALNQIQKEVAQVIVSHDDKSPTIDVRVETETASFRVDNVQGVWDVTARLREVFVFLQQHLKGSDVKLREIEYAACNGILRTLDPHSNFLDPEAYREMSVSTSGHFGGLGIVIAIRDQMLTVMRPMPDTPAGRAGLRRFDRILRINAESTVNMPLDDAVKRLRGAAGSKVKLWIQREGNEGWPGSRPFELVREEIQVPSVMVEDLGAGIGYVRLKQFQSGSSDELGRALDKLSAGQRLTGLVLDLRGNPGGLLDEAAEIADRFISEGVLVSTEGAAEGREEKRANRQGTEPNYPIVVLTNGSSASASEIVAGALKNLDRAVIVGQTTFGKGTVQIVIPRITPDGAALKLTIAQYLTPGDVSIQGVGVTPDIELDPMTADAQEMDLYRTDKLLRENDLSQTLATKAKRNTERPFATLRYDLPQRERARLRELGGDLDDQFELDFPTRFARDLARRLEPGRRPEQLKRAKAFVDETQAQEIAAITKELLPLGIDWQAPGANHQAGLSAQDYQVELTTDRSSNEATAGDPLSLRVTVKNTGKSPIFRLRAVTESDGGYYAQKELLFGKIEPGKSQTAVAPLGWCDVDGRKPGSSRPLPEDAPRSCRLPKDAITRQDVVKVRFFAEGGEPPRTAEIRPTVRSLARPLFAYSYQIVDDRPGNGDGELQKGEGATVYLTVKNVGSGPSFETQATLRNLAGDALSLNAGRFDISSMKPGDIRDVEFTLDVLDALPSESAKLELSVFDRDLGVSAGEKFSLPMASAPLAVQLVSDRMSVPTEAPVRSRPLEGAEIVGNLPSGAIVERQATVGSWSRVSLGGRRLGFVPSASLQPTTGKPTALRFVPSLRKSPPKLEIDPPPLATTNPRVHLQGLATDADHVSDVFIFVGSRKVFYQSNRKATDARQLRFSLDAELAPGINVITVVARQDQDVLSHHTLVVRRDGAGGEALLTPDREQFGTGWSFGDGE
jgi:carboxyl-terminal processing protease